MSKRKSSNQKEEEAFHTEGWNAQECPRQVSRRHVTRHQRAFGEALCFKMKARKERRPVREGSHSYWRQPFACCNEAIQWESRIFSLFYIGGQPCQRFIALLTLEGYRFTRSPCVPWVSPEADHDTKFQLYAVRVGSTSKEVGKESPSKSKLTRHWGLIFGENSTHALPQSSCT